MQTILPTITWKCFCRSRWPHIPGNSMCCPGCRKNIVMQMGHVTGRCEGCKVEDCLPNSGGWHQQSVRKCAGVAHQEGQWLSLWSVVLLLSRFCSCSEGVQRGWVKVVRVELGGKLWCQELMASTKWTLRNGWYRQGGLQRKFQHPVVLRELWDDWKEQLERGGFFLL